MKRFVKHSSLLAAACLIIFALSGFTPAQETAKTVVSPAEKTAVVKKISELLTKNYVFPETGREMEKLLSEKAAGNHYADISDAREFARRLTEDLQAVSRDRHLRVSFSPEVLPADPEDIFNPPQEYLEQIRRRQARENFGVKKLEILKGNIGLIRFDYFTSPYWAGDVYAAAMNYVAGADALIIDLRNNGGSMHEDAIPFICSYLFEKPVHLNDIYWRPKNSTKQFWTYPSVAGRRFLNKPIYVLTSRRTFSGGEEIAYDLKNLKRATVIGETTGGGAHGGGDFRASDHFAVWLPIGRAINPITKKNWEGTGVVPDIEIASNKALYAAHLQALGEILKTEKDEQWKQTLTNAAAETNERLKNFKKVAFRLKGFENAQTIALAGDFNSWSSRSVKMTRNGSVWTADVEIEPGVYEYKFVVDGRWFTDPDNPQTSGAGAERNSIVKVD